MMTRRTLLTLPLGLVGLPALAHATTKTEPDLLAWVTYCRHTDWVPRLHVVAVPPRTRRELALRDFDQRRECPLFGEPVERHSSKTDGLTVLRITFVDPKQFLPVRTYTLGHPWHCLTNERDTLTLVTTGYQGTPNQPYYVLTQDVQYR